MATRTEEPLSWLSCLLYAAVVLAVVAPAWACSTKSVDRGTLVNIQLRDFHIKISRQSVPAGAVTFRVRNDGPSTHELNIDRTTRDLRDLPLKKDGMSVDEASKQLKRITSLEEVFDGHRSNLTVNLSRGHYVLYCDMEGHYLGNMRTEIDVR